MIKNNADADARAGAGTRYEQQGEAYSKKCFKGRKSKSNGEIMGNTLKIVW